MKNKGYNKQYIMINENPKHIVKLQDFICEAVADGRDEAFVRSLFSLKLDYHYVLGHCELGSPGDITIINGADDGSSVHEAYKIISIKRIV